MTADALRFRADGSFRILQVSDPQDLVHPRRAMLEMLDRAYDGLRPDLVLFTGDNTLGNHLLDFGPVRIETLGRPEFTLRQMRRALAHILRPVQARGIPFAMIFGNHDDMNDVSREAQCALYRAYDRCLPMNEDDPTRDPDTYNIPIASSDGARTAWNLYMLDSAWTDETGGHCRIKEETVRWYRRTADALRAENGGDAVPALLFLHVPLPQTARLCMPCDETHPGAVRADGGGWVCLDPALAQGFLGESVSCGEDPYGLFDALREKGDVRAVVSGHDHANCFDGEYGGVRFIQSGAASFRCYGNRLRGVRLFVLHEDAPQRFGTKYYTYDEICGTGFRAQARYFWDADDKAVQKWTALGTAALGCAAAAAGCAVKKTLKNKRRDA